MATVVGVAVGVSVAVDVGVAEGSGVGVAPVMWVQCSVPQCLEPLR